MKHKIFINLVSLLFSLFIFSSLSISLAQAKSLKKKDLGCPNYKWPYSKKMKQEEFVALFRDHTRIELDGYFINELYVKGVSDLEVRLSHYLGGVEQDKEKRTYYEFLLYVSREIEKGNTDRNIKSVPLDESCSIYKKVFKNSFYK